MKIYNLKDDPSDEKKIKVANLLSKQITRSNEKEAFDKLLNGIHLAVSGEYDANILIAEKNDEIIGIAFYNVGVNINNGGPYLWLNELYVEEESRNQGIARKLLLHIIHLSENKGIKTIELETGINNSVTKHLYNSLGFQEIVSKRYRFTF
jgi:GNAT superfamily N-acetyltransferase